MDVNFSMWSLLNLLFTAVPLSTVVGPHPSLNLAFI